LMNINLFKILQNEQILQIIMKIKGKFFDEDLTEVLQLIRPALGTFDFLDILTYFLTTILFFAIRTT
ncbi:MAG: hypothetical protein II103_01870, partial [Treponema sp.]|nr:hypothetical protein [Treponema sp.]